DHVYCVLVMPTTPAIYSLSLHDALPICRAYRPPGRLERRGDRRRARSRLARTHGRDRRDDGARRKALWRRLERLPRAQVARTGRSEEHTSELQSRENLVCRLLLEKKKEK